MKKFVSGLLTGIFITLGTTVFAGYHTHSIEVVFDKVRVVIDGILLNKETLLYNGTTYVPLRAAGEALGMDIDYDSENSVAYFYSKKQTTTEETTIVTTREATTTTEATTEETTASKSKPKVDNTFKMSSSNVVLNYAGYASYDGRFDYKVIEKDKYSGAYRVELTAVGKMTGTDRFPCYINFYDDDDVPVGCIRVDVRSKNNGVVNYSTVFYVTDNYEYYKVKTYNDYF